MSGAEGTTDTRRAPPEGPVTDREHSSVVGLLADEAVTSRVLPFVPEKRAA